MCLLHWCYLADWAWCFQAWGLCRWYHSSGGGRGPRWSLQGRSYTGNTFRIWHCKVGNVGMKMYGSEFDSNLVSPHHAVSSMKIPSFSSCMKSSPPDSTTKQNWFCRHPFNRWFTSQHFAPSPFSYFRDRIACYHWDTPGWGRVFLQSGRRKVSPQWTGVSPSPESLAPLVYELCPLHYTLFLPTVGPKE